MDIKLEVIDKDSLDLVATYAGYDYATLRNCAESEGYNATNFIYRRVDESDANGYQTAAEFIRPHGYLSVSQMADECGESPQNLNNWFKKRRRRFDLLLQGLLREQEMNSPLASSNKVGVVALEMQRLRNSKEEIVEEVRRGVVDEMREEIERILRESPEKFKE